MKVLTPRESRELIEQGALYVDLREKDFADFKVPDLPDIFLLPYSLLESHYKQLPQDRLLILSDSSGLKTKKAAAFLMGNGYEKLAVLAGGFVEWERDGLPVRENIDERLSGACACQLKPRDRS